MRVSFGCRAGLAERSTGVGALRAKTVWAWDPLAQAGPALPAAARVSLASLSARWGIWAGV